MRRQPVCASHCSVFPVCASRTPCAPVFSFPPHDAMKYILYARKSSESEERQTLSIEAQLAELREFAEREQLEIVASFCEAKTAKEPGRIAFGEMLSMIERGDATGILSWHPDRLARNSVDGGRIIYLLDTGALQNLRFPTFWFESTPQGKFMLNIAFGQSKYYVDNLSENVKRGIRQKLRRGEWPALAPIGYTNNLKTKQIEIDMVRAPLVKKAFELYATGGYALRSLANKLKELGLCSHKENVISVSSVQRLLQNTAYYGMIHRLGELYDGAHEPIITKALFDEVQQVLSGKSRRKKRKRKHEFLFSGLMHCGSCGCAITAEMQKGHAYYRCTKKKGLCEEKYLREEDMLTQVRTIVEELSLPDAWAEKMLQHLDQENQDTLSIRQEETRCLAARKETLEKKIDALLDLKLNGALETDEYVRKKNALLNEKADIEQEMKQMQRGSDDRLEPIRNLIRASRDAKNLLTAEKLPELPAFLSSVGSNVLLTGKTLQWEAQTGWRRIARRGFCSDWLNTLVSQQNLGGFVRLLSIQEQRRGGHVGLEGFGSGTNGTRLGGFDVHILRTRTLSICLIKAIRLVQSLWHFSLVIFENGTWDRLRTEPYETLCVSQMRKPSDV